MKRTVVFALSLVTILASLVTVVYAQAPDPGTATSFGAVQNVDSTGVAHFQQDFYDQDGNLDATRTKSNVAYGDTMGLTTNQTTDAPLDTELPTGWVGSAVVSSDREAAAVVLIQYSGGSVGTDGVTTADYAGVQNPGGDVFCPSVGMRTYEASELVIMNTTDAVVSDVSISFKDRDGNDVGTALTGESVAAKAQKTYDLFDSSFGLPSNFLGSARVQSTGGSALAVVAITNWGNGTSGAFGTFGYNCQPATAAATKLYAPKVQRRKPSWYGGNWFDSSGVVVVNTESTAATVTVSFYDRDGNAAGDFSDTVPAYSARGYNTEYYGNADTTVIDGLVGSGSTANPEWQGSVVIDSTSGHNLVGIVKQGYEGNLWAAGYNMLSDADAGTDWFFPLVYRRGFNKAWTDYAGIICQNVTASSVAPVVTFVNRDTSASSNFTDAAAFGQYVSHGYNTRYGGNQDASWFGDSSSGATGNNLAGNFLGAAFVSAGSNIVCIQETWFEEVYNNGWIDGGDANLNNVYGK